MNKKDKGEVRELIIDALNEVMIPALDRLQVEVDDIKERMLTKDEGASKTDIDRLERRLIARENQADRIAKKVENHERRIEDLESMKN